MAHSQRAPDLEIRGIGWEQSHTHMIAFVAVHCTAAYLMKQWLQQADLFDLEEVVKTLTEGLFFFRYNTFHHLHIGCLCVHHS